MSTPTLDTVLACSRLPSLPTVAVEVLELTNQDNVRIRDIEEVVQNDPALVSRILKTVNSSYYGLSKPCPTIGPAITYLGLNTVKSLVLGFSLVDLNRRTGGQVDLIAYWQRCLSSAAAARRIATDQDADPDEAFIAALMQDIGMLAMEAALQDEYEPVLLAAGSNHDRLPELEREAYGFDHAEAGAELGLKWRLPAQIVEPIRNHHDGDRIDDDALLAKVVAVAARVGQALGHDGDPSNVAACATVAKRLLGFERSEFNEMLVSVANDVRQLSRLFKVDVGAMPDVGALLAQAEDARLAHEVRRTQEAETLRQANHQLTRQASTDGLTQIANRAKFDQELEAGLDQAAACRWPFALIMTDVDHFKKFNDTHGHQAGDLVLVELAQRYTEVVGSAGLACRYGGEEFGVLLPGTDRVAATQLAERLRRAVCERPVDLRSIRGAVDEVPVAASFGVAIFDPNEASVLGKPSLLLRAADRALYAAKHAGRNAVRVFRVRSSTHVA